MTNAIPDLLEWLAALPAEFAFLLALPFLVALAGLARHAVCRIRNARRGISVPARHPRLAREP